MSLPSDLVSGPMPARISWALLPVLAGPALFDELDALSSPVGLTASVMAWALWTGVLVAVLLPRTVSLTALRIAAPLVLVATAWSSARGEAGWLDVVAVGWGALTLVLSGAPSTGDAFVNGSSYGDERRLPLRIPGPLLLGPVQLAWLVAVAGPVAGPLLLAARSWGLGAVAIVVGLPAAVVAIRALHGLARRWVVFVPAGMVLHDPASLADPVLFRRADVVRLGPAPADPGTGALDATQGSLGLALELATRDPVQVAPRRQRRDAPVELVEVDRILFTPTRPGAVLAEATRRRIAVG